MGGCDIGQPVMKPKTKTVSEPTHATCFLPSDCLGCSIAPRHIMITYPRHTNSKHSTQQIRFTVVKQRQKTIMIVIIIIIINIMNPHNHCQLAALCQLYYVGRPDCPIPSAETETNTTNTNRHKYIRGNATEARMLPRRIAARLALHQQQLLIMIIIIIISHSSTLHRSSDPNRFRAHRDNRAINEADQYWKDNRTVRIFSGRTIKK